MITGNFRIAVAGLLAVSISACGFTPERRNVDPATIRVTDRFRTPVARQTVTQRRAVSGWWFLLQPCPREVAVARTSGTGIVKFDEVRDLDTFGATTGDARFIAGSIATRDTHSAHELCLNTHSGIATCYLQRFDWALEPVVETGREGLIRILDHYTRVGRTTFLSPSHYRRLGVITDRHIAALTQVIPLLSGPDHTVEYLWGSHRVQIPSLDTAIH